MIIQAKCKICGKELSLKIDDTYAKMRDPYKLVPMATCNACYDARFHRKTLEQRIGRICARFIGVSDKKRQSLLEQWQRPLELWMDKYTQLLCAQYHKRSIVCDESVWRSLLEHPEVWGKILNRWHLYIEKTLV